jgi:hypothetical protein
MAMDPRIMQLLQNPQALDMLARRLAASGRRPPVAPTPGQVPPPQQMPPQQPTPTMGGGPLNIGQLVSPKARPVMPRPTMTAPVRGGPVPSIGSLINPAGGGFNG